MMRSMFAGVSGLRNHQIRMDVIGNNIANVNTVGYKTSRVTFQDALSQTLKGATAPQNNRGGINPQQVGLGVMLSSIDVLHTAGNLQTTGVNTDLALQGNGFFIVGDGSQNYYTRAGNFSMDTSGRLAYSNGLQLQGWGVRSDGSLDTTLKGITLPINSTIAPRATTELNYNVIFDASLNGTLSYAPMTVGTAPNTAEMTIKLTPTGVTNQWGYEVITDGTIIGNGTGTITLNSDGTVNTITGGGNFQITPPSGGPNINITVPLSGGPNTFSDGTVSITGDFNAPSFMSNVEVFDSLGTSHKLTTTFTKVDNTTWTWVTTEDGVSPVGTGPLVFDTQGNLTSSTGGPITFTPPGAEQVQITPNFLESKQYDGESSVAWSQNGYKMGYLDSFKIDSAGKIIGVFTNGLTKDIAQVAVATFANPGGLEKMGETMFQVSSNSGEAQINPSGVGGSGKITPGTLEMSNVDLSQEFTDMIVTQRGFQANSRIITTSDEMLQELVNLKR